MLVTSNFSFSHSVFKRHVLQTRKNQGLFGKGLSKQHNFTLIQIKSSSYNLKVDQMTKFVLDWLENSILSFSTVFESVPAQGQLKSGLHVNV